jgi:tRNA A-37 threonylcarbamoyl transferase component Bud32
MEQQKQQEKIKLVVAENYEMLDCVGSGANGSVYKARHALSDLISAIKVLNEQKDEQDIKRFQREAQTIAKLSHPNIIAMRDFGIKDGAPYLVMEYVEGESLADLIKREGRLSPERAAHIFIQVCEALQHAHEQQVFHRDIKPSNIMLMRKGDKDIVKLADFGIAKIKTPETRESLTATGAVLGTPLYMSPEQAMGHQPDALSDIYSLGCVMYECFAGRAPIEGDNFLEVVYRRVNEKPPTFTALGVEVPTSFANIIYRCLHNNPEDRYQSAAAIADDLRAALGGQQISKSRSRAKFTAKQLLAPALALAVCAGIAVAFFAGQSFHGSAPSPATSVSKQFEPVDPALIPAMPYLRANIHIEGGFMGRNDNSKLSTSKPNATTEAAAMNAPRVKRALARWREYYGSIFDQLNPPPSGKGPAVPKEYFGFFEVTIDKNRNVTVIPNQSVTTSPADTVYTNQITKILKDMTGSDQLAFPEDLSSVEFRVEARGQKDAQPEFILSSWDHPLTSDERK